MSVFDRQGICLLCGELASRHEHKDGNWLCPTMSVALGGGMAEAAESFEVLREVRTNVELDDPHTPPPPGCGPILARLRALERLVLEMAKQPAHVNEVLEDLAKDAELRSQVYCEAAASVTPKTVQEYLSRGDFMGRAFEASEMAKLIRRAKR